MASDWEVADEKPADDAWQVESERPAARRGGSASEMRAPLGFRGPPDLDAAAKQPLPDGVMPSQAGGGRGFVNPMSAGVQRADSAYQNRDEAINDAVDRIEQGANPAQVFEAFGRMGVSQQDIVARGQALGGRMFAPQRAQPVQSQRLTGNPNAVDTVAPVEPNVVQDGLNAVRRGAEQFKQTVDAGRFMAGGIDASQMAEQNRIGQRRMGALAPSSDLQGGLDRLQDANKTGEWGPVLSAIAEPRNWPALASLVVESAVATGPTMVAGALATALAGGAGGMPVTAASSFAQEYAAALGDELEKRGIDASDPVKVAMALQDPDVRAAIDERGRIRGAAVGAFDSISMGAAGAIGRTLRRMEQAGRLTKGAAIKGAAAGAGVEVGGGMAGEALGQAGVGESKKLDVAIEGLAEGPGGIVDVAASFLRPQKAMPPLQAKSEAVKRFDELAAAHGINSAAVQRAKAATADMPADEVPGFLARLTEAMSKRGLVAKPIDQQSLQALGQALGDKPAEPATDKASQAVDNIESILRRGGALPDSEAGRPPAATGGADGQTQEEAQGLLKQDAPADVTTAGAQQQDGAPRVEGEPINRKWTSFAPESGTLSIPREQMPQVDAEHRGALVNFLAARGVAADQETVAADSLKPTQREFEPGKVKAMAEGGGSKRRILVSSDDHILDGHHQWLAKREAGQPVDVIRLDAPIQDLLRLAHQFPSSTTAKGPRTSNDQPVVPANAGTPAPQPADGRDQLGGSGRVVGSDADQPQRVGDGPRPPETGRVENATAAGSQAAADQALKPRILGSYGRSPSGATEIELRPNDDGTLTPYTGKYAMVEHESGDPIRVPANATDAEVVDAIRASGAVTNRDRFFGVKADKSNAAPADAGESGQTGGDGAAQPGAATQTGEAQDAQARKAELVQRATWLRKLIKCLGS